MEQTANYLINAVAKQTGIKSELIRAWEKRYQAVNPVRTEKGRRLYSEQDIAKLRLLFLATKNGHSISNVANLSLSELQILIDRKKAIVATQPITGVNTIASKESYQTYVADCLEHIKAFDQEGLENQFEMTLAELGTYSFIENFISPLLYQIGELWESQQLRPVHEHMAFSSIRSFAYILKGTHTFEDNAPRIVLGTPAGQGHELGSLLASIIAETIGWKTTFLGPNLPAEELAAAAKFSSAQVVAISIKYIPDLKSLSKEIRRINTLMPKGTSLIIGGKQDSRLDYVIKEVNACFVKDFNEFRERLKQLASLDA